MRVAIVGGGVIGLTLAWELHRAGADVMLLEEGRCGQGASAGNAGWIVPAFSTPVPAPGVTRQALRWLLQPGSPFTLRFRLDAAYLRWLRQFVACSSAAHYEAGIAALASLNASTLSLFTRLRAEGVEFEMHEPGLLFVARTPVALDSYAQTLDELSEHGYGVGARRLTGVEARALEPALGTEVVAALHAPLERSVRPETLTRGLLHAIRRAGADIREHTPVTALQPLGSRWAIQTPTAVIEADRVVIAAGIRTRHLAAKIGIRLPLESAKGYSLTTATAGPTASHLIYFAETKTAYTPFYGGVRLAGLLELGATDTRVSAAAIRTLTRSARRFLADWRPEGASVAWAGLRPLTPDGLPLIGPIPGRPGAFVATGHGMLGVTLAPATARALGLAVLGATPDVDLAPFAPSRFLS